jgi:hypothetical protein
MARSSLIEALECSHTAEGQVRARSGRGDDQRGDELRRVPQPAEWFSIEKAGGQREIVIVPFIVVGWMLQWMGYEPAR